jgi:undecaprenyl diphosphate synthase
MINPKHIAIILDGNGRWAEKRGKARTQGHVEGAKTLKKIIQTIQNKDIDVVSLFVFSTENWKRPSKEVDFLMSLPKRFEKDIDDLSKNEDGIQVVFSGRKDRLSEPNKLLIDKYVMQSEMNQGLTVNVCLDYGFKDEMVHVAKTLAKKVKEGALDISEIDETLIDESLYTHPLPPVDLVIRTSGEQRLSNFLLWQSAYAEIYFTETLWPDFDEEALEKALTFYQSRTRRFGKVDYE